MKEHFDGHVTLCAGLAVGCLDDRERREIADHLALGCGTCADALEGFRRATLTLARSVAPTQPGRALRARVLADALLTAEQRGGAAGAGGRVLEVHTGHAMSWKGWGALYLAVVLAVLAGIAWLEVRRLHGEIAEAQALMDRLARTYATESHWSVVLTSPAARVAVLAPAASAWPAAAGRANFDPATGRALVVCRGLPAGEHVLWGRTGAGWRRLASLRPDGQGGAVARIESAGDASLTTLALSQEPSDVATAAGPAGPVVLRGEFGR
jgi:hypothetical protein